MYCSTHVVKVATFISKGSVTCTAKLDATHVFLLLKFVACGDARPFCSFSAFLFPKLPLRHSTDHFTYVTKQETKVNGPSTDRLRVVPWQLHKIIGNGLIAMQKQVADSHL